MVVFQMIGGINRQGEDHIQVVAIVLPVKGHGQFIAVGNEVEWSAVLIRNVKRLFVDVSTESVVTHFGIDGQSGIVGVVDVLGLLKV